VTYDRPQKLRDRLLKLHNATYRLSTFGLGTASKRSMLGGGNGG